MAKQPCITCKTRPKYGNRQRCIVCFTRAQGVTERVAESRRRSAMIPEALRKRVVAQGAWPPGTRWCGGCQSFVDIEDVGKNASQCKACVSARSHAAMVAKTYGIDADEYERILALQGGKCAICRARPKSKRLAVDHDHKTGVVRGLLCSRCNHELLGAGWDSRIVLEAAVRYLDTPPASGLWTSPESHNAAQPRPTTPPEAAQPPPKASRLADPPGARAAPEAQGGGDGWPRRSNSSMSVDELILIGGSRDENGFYRLYQHRDDDRMPF